MNSIIPIQLFISGLILGVSQCMLSCAPILLFYVAGTRSGWWEGMKATLVFSFSRLFAYIVLGTIAGLVGMYLNDFLHTFGFSKYFWIGAGIFIIFIGVLIIFGKEPHIALCKILFKGLVKNSNISMGILGFIIGFASYCAPLIGILTFIAFNVKSPLMGAFYALCFGFGASIVTPIIIVGILAGILPRLIFRSQKFLIIFRRTCGVIFLFLGGRILFDNLKSFW